MSFATLEAEVVAFAVCVARLDAAAATHEREAIGVVVAAEEFARRRCGLRGTGVRPNSPPQITSVSSSRPRLFKSLMSAATACVVTVPFLGQPVADVLVRRSVPWKSQPQSKSWT